MESSRTPSKQEITLIKLLVDKSTKTFPLGWEDNLSVQPMSDGGMGSLLLLPKGITNQTREFGECISEYQFLDVDGINVIVSLNVDKSGELFELDVWKTDFNPLIRFPKNL